MARALKRVANMSSVSTTLQKKWVAPRTRFQSYLHRSLRKLSTLKRETNSRLLVRTVFFHRDRSPSLTHPSSAEHHRPRRFQTSHLTTDLRSPARLLCVKHQRREEEHVLLRLFPKLSQFPQSILLRFQYLFRRLLGNKRRRLSQQRSATKK